MPHLRAVLFDLDGVLTPTAELHMRAWERLFAPFCTERGVAPYTSADYFAYIDGKPRFDGVAALLESRGIDLPRGADDDPPGDGSVTALGNRKNDIVNVMFASEGITPYPGSVAFLDAVQAADVQVAVVSSSRNAPAVLAAANLADRFRVVVDGEVAARDHLPGKPAPDTFVRAAELLNVPVAESVVVEDAVSGVRAGRAGAFGLVIGVDRGVGASSLTEAGADVVVDDLGDVDVPAMLSGGLS